MITRGLGLRLFVWIPPAICLMAFSHGSPLQSGHQKQLRPEQVIQSHMDSIGTASARASWKSSVALGASTLQVWLQGKRSLPGTAAFYSQERSYRSSLRFDLSDYPAEEISFDGRKTFVGLLNPRERSLIGQFLYDHDELLKEGLFGGVLSTGWPLLSARQYKPKIKYTGWKTGYGSGAHQLTYQLHGSGSEINVRLYFDGESFRHVATVYQLRIADGEAVPPYEPEGASRLGIWPDPLRLELPKPGTLYTLEEFFSDFRRVESLTLPFSWRVRLTVESETTPGKGRQPPGHDFTVVEWEAKFETIRINEKVDPNTFVLY